MLRFSVLSQGLLCLLLAGSSQVALATVADDVCPPLDDPCEVTGEVLVDSGSILDFGTRELLLPGGSGKKLDVGSGAMTIRAGQVTVNPGSAIVGRGGFIDVITTGDIVVKRAGTTNGRIDVSDLLSPGAISLETLAPGGNVIIDGVVTAAGTGFDAGGAGIDITAMGDVAIGGEVLAGGGGGAFGGDVTIAATGQVTSSGRVDTAAGDGGDITMTAGTGMTFTAEGSAKMTTRATNAGGDAGDVDLATIDGNIDLGQEIEATGAPEIDFAGSGGSVTLDAATGSVLLSEEINASGAVPDGDGGDLDVTAGLDIIQTGPVSLVGKRMFGQGGFVDYLAVRAVTVGPIDVRGDCDDCGGGDVFITGQCDVTVPAGVIVNATGSSGRITLATGQDMTVVGALLADAAVQLRHRDALNPPVTAGSTIVPPAVVVVDLAINQCGCMPGVCGDGVLNCGEACDDGGTGACDGCASDCSRVDDVCGDGFFECLEECDDANLTDCDGCSRLCGVETCGNFVVECEEQCDEGGVMTETCMADCRVPPPPGCGDGNQDPGEACDDANLIDCDGCSRLCEVEACGNGATECLEACDDFNDQPCDGCSPTCTVEECGNGLIDCGEECDEGAQNGQPGSVCTTECTMGEICTAGGSELCIPCVDSLDCDPLQGVCAGLTCVAGVCEMTGITCDDGNVCTMDGCDPATGCTQTLLQGADVPECDDGDACTTPECDLVEGCVQRTMEDFPGILCHFATIDSLLATEGIDPKAKTALQKLADKGEAKVQSAAQGEVDGKQRKIKKGLKGARGRIRKLRKKTQKFGQKQKIDVTVATELLDEADATEATIDAQLRSFGFLR